MTLHGRDAGSYKLKTLSSKARYVFDGTALHTMILDLIYLFIRHTLLLLSLIANCVSRTFTSIYVDGLAGGWCK